MPSSGRKSFTAIQVVSLLCVLGCTILTEAWTVLPVSIRQQSLQKPRSSITSPTRLYETNATKGFFNFFSPYESKIPSELRDEIYAAEANTPAAQERGQRVALYILIAFCGILSAFFNGFLSELRANGPDGNGVNLSDAGFDWVVNNPVLTFLFLNKIGGGISLVGGAGAGLLAEAELDTKRINAEKIFEELERRRRRQVVKSKKTEVSSSSSSPSSNNNKKRKRSGKEAKRLVALSEVIMSEEKATNEKVTEAERETEAVAVAGDSRKMLETSKSEGLLGSLKSLYDKADTMAASQALLLNKKLEEAGIVEKITDETGLKVIGRDEVAKLKDKKENTES